MKQNIKYFFKIFLYPSFSILQLGLSNHTEEIDNLCPPPQDCHGTRKDSHFQMLFSSISLLTCSKKKSSISMLLSGREILLETSFILTKQIDK